MSKEEIVLRDEEIEDLPQNKEPPKPLLSRADWVFVIGMKTVAGMMAINFLSVISVALLPWWAQLLLVPVLVGGGYLTGRYIRKDRKKVQEDDDREKARNLYFLEKEKSTWSHIVKLRELADDPGRVQYLMNSGTNTAIWEDVPKSISDRIVLKILVQSVDKLPSGLWRFGTCYLYDQDPGELIDVFLNEETMELSDCGQTTGLLMNFQKPVVAKFPDGLHNCYMCGGEIVTQVSGWNLDAAIISVARAARVYYFRNSQP